MNITILFFNQAAEVIRVIQLNTLEDRSVHDKQQWDSAVNFVKQSVTEKLDATEGVLSSLVGPSRTQQWMLWTNATPEQKQRTAVKNELERLLFVERVCQMTPFIFTIISTISMFVFLSFFFHLRITLLHYPMRN